MHSYSFFCLRCIVSGLSTGLAAHAGGALRARCARIPLLRDADSGALLSRTLRRGGMLAPMVASVDCGRNALLALRRCATAYALSHRLCAPSALCADAARLERHHHRIDAHTHTDHCDIANHYQHAINSLKNLSFFCHYN